LLSFLLKRLIGTVSSSSLISRAVKLLSHLNKDAADQGDIMNLFISSSDQFPEVLHYAAYMTLSINMFLFLAFMLFVAVVGFLF
jgi:large-conductance mechanosensitive channel